MEGEGIHRISDAELSENGMAKMEDVTNLVQHIRVLAMQLQRYKPAEWNEFLDVALDN